MPLPSESQTGGDAALRRDVAALCRTAVRDAPEDGAWYVRRDGAWEDAYAALKRHAIDRLHLAFVVDPETEAIVIDPSDGSVVIDGDQL